MLTLPLLLLVPALFVMRIKPLHDKIPFSKVYFSRQNNLLGMYPASDEQYRYYTHISSYPRNFISIILLQEDRYFHLHPGVNPVSLLRGFYQTYVIRNRRMGGSTITMQLARLYYGLNTQSIPGKINQILHALYMDLFHSKQEILETYLNLVPCGGNIQGFPAASLHYFSRSLDELNLGEMMMLCILPQNPQDRNPRNAENHSEILMARNRLHERWKSVYSGREERIFHLELLPVIHPEPRYKTPHLTELLRTKFTEKEGMITSIDWDLQREIHTRLKSYVARNSDRGVKNGAALVLNYQTMELLAMIGSADFFDESIQGMVNGTNSRRSPGSTLKPFIYGQGLDQGLIHSNSILHDRPVSFSSYTPDNYKEDFHGPVPVWAALVNSRNIPAVELNSNLHDLDLHDLLALAEVGELKEKNHYGLSIVLGTAELTMLELAGLYAAIGNEGRLKDILIGRDRVLKSFPEKNIMSPQASRVIRLILERNPSPEKEFPISESWNPVGKEVPAAWKTGTSIGFKDAWSIGLHGPYVMAVWIGNFSGEGNPAFLGRSIAAPFLFDMTKLLESRVKNFRLKFVPGVSIIEVCAISGSIPGKYCQHLEQALFMPGISPAKLCGIHRPFWIDEETGLRVRTEGAGTKMIVREVWPSDLLKLFREAGIPRPVPPPFEDKGIHTDRRMIQPTILSPVARATYILRPELDRFGKIPLMGAVDGEVNEIFWFANGIFLGKTQPEETLIWTPSPGQYDLILLDDQGLSQERSVTVLMEL